MGKKSGLVHYGVSLGHLDLNKTFFKIPEVLLAEWPDPCVKWLHIALFMLV